MRYSEITDLSIMVILVNGYRFLIEFPSECCLKGEEILFWTKMKQPPVTVLGQFWGTAM